MNPPFKHSRGAPGRLLGVLLGALVAAAPAAAGSLENLERERALLIKAMLSPDLAPVERQSRFETSRQRLVDLERIVLRDDKLVARNTPAVRRAFSNYDLTFLVHAAIEKDISVVDNWLEQIGVTTQSLMSAKMGRRWNAEPSIPAGN